MIVAEGQGWIAEIERMPNGLFRYRYRATSSLRWDQGYEVDEQTAQATVVFRLGEKHMLGMDELVSWRAAEPT